MDSGGAWKLPGTKRAWREVLLPTRLSIKAWQVITVTCADKQMDNHGSSGDPETVYIREGEGPGGAMQLGME